jgi:hypothetical protein
VSTTVFCTFDQQDIADLAMGRLRNSVKGIHSFEYLSEYGQDFSNHTNQDYNFISGWGLFSNATSGSGLGGGAGVQPSHPVSVKITCDDNVKDMIVSKLVNLHAYRIVAS